MIENKNLENIKYKKRKALKYAILITILIASLYIFLPKQDLYQFKGFSKDVTPVASFIKDVSNEIPKDMSIKETVINK